MIIQQPDGRRVRKPAFDTFKEIGAPRYVLAFTRKQSPGRGIWGIPVEYGGRLAMTFHPTGLVDGQGNPKRFRAVSWRQLPADFRAAALQAIEHIERAGDPIDNDESIYAESDQ